MLDVVDTIEIEGLECAVYCFAFVWCVIRMESKDGSNTLAKELCKQKTRSGKTYAVLHFWCCWLAKRQ